MQILLLAIYKNIRNFSDINIDTNKIDFLKTLFIVITYMIFISLKNYDHVFYAKEIIL